MFNQCPGQDSRKAKAESIICVHCGCLVEIFSDEIKVVCTRCKNLIFQERPASCLDWCKVAKECVGEEKWNKIKG